MHATLTIRDETTFSFDNNTFIFTLDLMTERVTARELLRERVRHEVEEYNARQPEYFRGLVQPVDAEKTLNGYRLRTKRQLDWEEQLDKALEAFDRYRFILLVDDRQVEALDEVIEITPETSVTFLKLVPLVGG
ncbi:MAG TPA: hypothetical protein VF658_04720 [Pyrinomonadaceae bacterium]